MDELPPADETDETYECFDCGSTIVDGRCPYCCDEARLGRRSPWYGAKEELRVGVPVPPRTMQMALISNLTPNRKNIRLGVLINGRESSITVPFDHATRFMRQVEALIQDKGER